MYVLALRKIYGEKKIARKRNKYTTGWYIVYLLNVCFMILIKGHV